MRLLPPGRSWPSALLGERSAPRSSARSSTIFGRDAVTRLVFVMALLASLLMVAAAGATVRGCRSRRPSTPETMQHSPSPSPRALAARSRSFTTRLSRRRKASARRRAARSPGAGESARAHTPADGRSSFAAGERNAQNDDQSPPAVIRVFVSSPRRSRSSRVLRRDRLRRPTASTTSPTGTRSCSETDRGCASSRSTRPRSSSAPSATGGRRPRPRSGSSQRDRVRLMPEPATDRVDDYGRLLRYVVRVSDGVNVNVQLVASGSRAVLLRGSQGPVRKPAGDARETGERRSSGCGERARERRTTRIAASRRAASSAGNAPGPAQRDSMRSPRSALPRALARSGLGNLASLP